MSGDRHTRERVEYIDGCASLLPLAFPHTAVFPLFTLVTLHVFTSFRNDTKYTYLRL